FKRKPARQRAESQVANPTKVEVVVPNVNAELSPSGDISPPALIADAKAPQVADPAPNQGALLAPWSEDSVIQAESRPPRARTPFRAKQQEPTSMAEVPAPPAYAVFEFLSPCEKPGYLGSVANFRVRELIGDGGMGFVFLAEDKYLKGPVALKVMKPRVARRKRCWGWFLDEARATSALQSDRIATIYQIGEHRGVLYLAMELLHGESLDSRLRRAALPVDMALWIAKEAAQGLALVH